MSTPLERYAEAFGFQKNGNIKAAEKIYLEIIEKYPGSPEREYSSVQIEKINSDRILEKEKQDSSAKAAIAEKAAMELKQKAEAVLLEEKKKAENEKRQQEENKSENKEKGKATEKYQVEEDDFIGVDEDEEDEIKIVKVKKKPYGRMRIVNRFTTISGIALAFSILSVVLVLLAFILQAKQDRGFEYLEALQKATLSLKNNDEREFMRHVLDAKSAWPDKNMPYFMIVDYYLNKNKKDLALKELHDCPQFDSDYKAYAERIKNFKVPGTAP